MKRLASFLLMTVLIVMLCACSNKEQANNSTMLENASDESIKEAIDENSTSNQKEDNPVDENAVNGYFRIQHISVLDRWGEVQEVREQIVAVAEAHDKNGKSVDPVTVFYNCGGYCSSNHYFFFVPGGNTSRYTSIKNLGVKIGAETDQVVPNKDNYVAEDTEAVFYTWFENEFMAGNDITFSQSSY